MISYFSYTVFRLSWEYKKGQHKKKFKPLKYVPTCCIQNIWRKTDLIRSGRAAYNRAEILKSRNSGFSYDIFFLDDDEDSCSLLS